MRWIMSDKKIMNESLVELYTNDEWTREFMHSVYEMFGLPKSTENCLNKTDKILFVWGMMTLVQEMKRSNNWLEMKKDLSPEDAALQFVKNHYEEKGHLLLASIVEDEKYIEDIPGDVQ